MREYPKKIKKLIREFAAEAHERELHRELTSLDRHFAEWRNGRLGSGALSDLIHQYEKGPSRELFKRYNGDLPDLMVAYAVTAGILKRGEIPAELLEALAGPLEYFDRLKDRGGGPEGAVERRQDTTQRKQQRPGDSS